MCHCHCKHQKYLSCFQKLFYILSQLLRSSVRKHDQELLTVRAVTIIIETLAAVAFDLVKGQGRTKQLLAINEKESLE